VSYGLAGVPLLVLHQVALFSADEVDLQRVKVQYWDSIP
jgi:hypothetical protein